LPSLTRHLEDNRDHPPAAQRRRKRRYYPHRGANTNTPIREDGEPEIDQPKNLNTFVISPCYNQINKLITLKKIQATTSNRLIFAKKN